MVLILSKEQGENTTEEVMDWLSYFNCDFQRFNGDNLQKRLFKITLQNGNTKNSSIFHNYDGLIRQDKVSVVWNRRWRESGFLSNIEQEVSKDFSFSMKMHLSNEFNRVSQYLNHLLAQKKWVDKPNLIQPNKLIVLEMAAQCGLWIPNTLITNSKQEVLDFLEQNNRICTKSIHEVASFTSYSSNNAYLMDTKEAKKEHLMLLDDLFFPSLFQKLIEKKFDIRIFYLEGQFYAMAIFSQRRAVAALDFRNYNYVDPDRNVPFILPKHIQSNLHQLVQKIGYEHCSIDMMKDINNNYYFLEINPVGQFGMVSKPCNYQLEMKLAIYLNKKNNEK
jgi:ATP-GRASP peptide maturase of grasp-with-spasm system